MLRVFTTVKNIGKKFFFPLTTVLPVPLLSHLPILICLLMSFSQNWTLVSSFGVRMVISLFYIHTIYGVHIHVSIFLYIYILFCLKPEGASVELKKKTIHILTFSYFAVGFLNKKKIKCRFPRIFKKFSFGSGNCGTVQFHFQSMQNNIIGLGKRGKRWAGSPKSRVPAITESPVAEFVSDSVTAAAYRTLSATFP